MRPAGARDCVHAGFVELIHPAKATGRLFDDFVAKDLVLLQMADSGVLGAIGDGAPEASPRLVAYMLQACGADGSPTLPPAPTPRRMYRAMMRISSRPENRRRRS
jgi:hypothetical protein